MLPCCQNMLPLLLAAAALHSLSIARLGSPSSGQSATTGPRSRLMLHSRPSGKHTQGNTTVTLVHELSGCTERAKA